MKLAISNIAWADNEDAKVFEMMKSFDFCGLEIAPSRFVANEPYEIRNVDIAKERLSKIKSQYSLEICSMQSLLFGRIENLFNSVGERNFLLEYTQKAIDYAEEIDCKNLVFGSPKNRVIRDYKIDYGYAIDFFSDIANYAEEKHVFMAIEANPKEYGCNFINTTREAINFIKDVNSPGLTVNLDLGTMLLNKENVENIESYLPFISHIHISEPFLEKIKDRDEHTALASLLNKNGYAKFVSIEMKRSENTLEDIKMTFEYINKIFR